MPTPEEILEQINSCKYRELSITGRELKALSEIISIQERVYKIIEGHLDEAEGPGFAIATNGRIIFLHVQYRLFGPNHIWKLFFNYKEEFSCEVASNRLKARSSAKSATLSEIYRSEGKDFCQFVRKEVEYLRR